MARVRTIAVEQADAAIEELLAVTEGLWGIEVTRSGPQQVTVRANDVPWPATVVVRESIAVRDLDPLEASRGSKLIVANRISGEAKARALELTRTTPFGWSWFDRVHGELQLNHPQTTAVVHVPAAAGTVGSPGPLRLARTSAEGPIRGRAGISTAAALLLTPDATPTIRSVATAVGMSHGAVGAAVKQLREAGLIRPDGTPSRSELFWALARVWGPTRVTPVALLPTIDQYRHLNPADPPAGEPVTGAGWALGGDAAAQAWGAPMISLGSAPVIWVPQEGDARRIERILTPTRWGGHAAVVALAPTLQVTSTRRWPPDHAGELDWIPSTHPLFLALDLARDPARGHEVLEAWRPPPAVAHRVW